MILPEFSLEFRKNKVWEQSGLDSSDLCLDKTHFKNYPYKVNYHYNSRGFRDSEWPENFDDLRQSIWCVGDSFTVGIGSPLEHTWVNILQNVTGRRCINISMDGASNEWIVRKTLEIINVIDPIMPISLQYSYWHRREDINTHLSDEVRRQQFRVEDSFSELAKLFVTQHQSLISTGKDIVFSSVTNAFPKMKESLEETWNLHFQKHERFAKTPCPTSMTDFNLLHPTLKADATQNPQIANFIEMYTIINSNQFYQVDQIDYARDKWHYDKLTATNVANYVATFIDS